MSFSAPFAAPDETLVPALLPLAEVAPETRQRAERLIQGIRRAQTRIGGLEDFLRDYDLSTREGLALMAMAEALLRVPDEATQDALIADKIGAGKWDEHAPSDAWLVSAATWGLDLSNRLLRPGDTVPGVLTGLARRIGTPAVRTGVRQAMRFMGHQFVLGETIEGALKRARENEAKGALHSYDMLGEGAKTRADAERYAKSYAGAIDAIGRAAGNRALPRRPGISVKLSALHPRYEPRNRAAVLRELTPILVDLARKAKSYDLNFTVDAEEQDRLELSLEVIGAAFEDEGLRDWNGFGLAIQAYGKRAESVIDWTGDLARRYGQTMMVRLVKGAYWDTEIKHAQVEGHADYPVFTRKAVTDLNYLACAKKMLALRPHLYPQFATHNALTIAKILEMDAEGHGTGNRHPGGFEFQRLHGMGEALYAAVAKETEMPCRIYAPVGGHRDLLAYLVRRLLENGASTSFVAMAGDKDVDVAAVLDMPQDLAATPRHPRIPMPNGLFAGRRNSAGVEIGARRELDALCHDMQRAPAAPEIAPMAPSDIDGAMSRARAAFADWSTTAPATRAAILRRAADLLEAERPALMATLAREAGKTIDDGIAEIREAVDFLRFYADEAETLCQPRILPGPTGESNEWRVRGRGVFVTVAPWNFPLAIFLGQNAAALAAGNAVATKPAPQTPRIAAQAVALMHRAGVPEDALILVPGGVETGQALIAHPDVAGVAFTGSTATAKAINLALAQKDGPIVPLIAETGGVNAMIVDATALPEQVTRDVVASAFRSAGQRCSACRIVYLQEDVADRMLEMFEGAAATLTLGDAMDPATDIGPVIDEAALRKLREHVSAHRVRWQGDAPPEGLYMPPTIIELGPDDRLTEEVFGPVLHVKRWKAGRIDAVLDEIESTGFGLTFGLHSRIDHTIDRVTARAPAGNVYVNRNQIGAIVGSQPFGGRGKSGTGPKAGGPLYLQRFVEEVVVSTDTTAAGGNATLIAMESR
ncbi:bifunctional proline dehydrogenase/L-glutamate gamma-semialdehyde dehydrogenase PutA [uncultured Jannaschia sp.]|uniref:bifunctional proline dehydrogenase/L-glutamate gamma-semialdehyde dehydrogenase PutA n=1 Tax=uncultured Jannaschia sp. TaxID=293347 RepID=UPI00261CB041|nr:bifunctional proline dehydrogenase/L-glutamate gamma-semialdehyde dehydrogenase PutA [uncultured Jannaschia sp.]